MIYLLLSIMANVGIFLCFRLFAKYRLGTLQAIVINYLVCVITGVLFIGDFSVLNAVSTVNSWSIWAVLLGVAFILGFNLTAITTQKMGMTVASVSTKMSLIVPVLMSMFVFQIESKSYSFINYIGIFLALVAVVLTSIKEKEVDKNTPLNAIAFFLPLSIFIIGGFIDTTINYVNYRYISEEEEAIFPIVIFGAAFIIGALVLLFKKETIAFKDILGGIVLGITNYFSIYFLVRGLSSFNNNGALVYPVLNVGIILLTALASVFVFRVNLSKVNKLGLAIAIVSILSIFYQEIWEQIQ